MYLHGKIKNSIAKNNSIKLVYTCLTVRISQSFFVCFWRSHTICTCFLGFVLLSHDPSRTAPSSRRTKVDEAFRGVPKKQKQKTNVSPGWISSIDGVVLNVMLYLWHKLTGRFWQDSCFFFQSSCDAHVFGSKNQNNSKQKAVHSLTSAKTTIN